MNKAFSLTAEYKRYVDVRIMDQCGNCFVGREWVFRALSHWLTDSSHYFIVTGAPGAGKTAVAAQLCSFALGEANSFQLTPNFLTAVHFFSHLDGWTDAREFVQSIALQLRQSLPAFAAAYSQAIQDRSRVGIHASITCEVNNGEVVAVKGEHIHLPESTLRSYFDIMLRQPLAIMSRSNPDIVVLILVDALDEVQASDEEELLSLLLGQDMPRCARFILTARPDSHIHSFCSPHSPGVRHVDLSDDQSDADIRAYVVRAVRTSDPPLLAPDSDISDIDVLCTTVQEKSQRNFLYVYHLFKMLATEANSGPLTASRLRALTLPLGIKRFYLAFLRRALPAKYLRDNCKPVLGILATAAERLTLAHIANFCGGIAHNEAWSQIEPLLPFVVSADNTPAEDVQPERYALFHRSFAEFILDSASREFWCQAGEYHRLISHYYANVPVPNWDAYGKTHASRHLSEAIRDWPHAPNRLGFSARHELIAEWIQVVSSSAFEHRQQDDLLGAQHDARRVVEASATDTHTASPILVVKSALAWESLRNNALTPASVFALARDGHFDSAQDRLLLFDINPAWYHAILLIIASLAAEQSPAEVRKLLNKLKSRNIVSGRAPGSRIEVLETLYHYAEARVNATLSPTANIPDCTLCAECPQLLDTLSALHGLDRYDYYRNNSLWRILEWMLNCCKNDSVAVELAQGLALAALTPNRPEFREALDISVITRDLLSGKRVRVSRRRLATYEKQCTPPALSSPNSVQEDEKKWSSLLELCSRLRGNKAGDTLLEVMFDIRTRVGKSLEASKGDTWAFFRRRSALLAQVYKATGSANQYNVYLRQAMTGALGGFPGCHMLACFFLAETIDMLDSYAINQEHIETVLGLAHDYALKTHDPHHCAINVARWHAMKVWSLKERTWREPVEQFVADPTSPEFAALHEIGELYEGRPDLMTFRLARTLEDLKAAYGWYTLFAFQQLNPEWASTPTAYIPVGTKVRVPNRRFSALMACRLAAGVFADRSIPQPDKVSLIQRLVPATLNNPTALNILLSRLLLAADNHITSAEQFPEIASIAERWATPRDADT